MSSPSMVPVSGPSGPPVADPAGDAQKLLNAREVLRSAPQDLATQERTAKGAWMQTNVNDLVSKGVVFTSIASSYNDLSAKVQSFDAQKKAITALVDEINGHLGYLISQYAQAIEPVLARKRDELQAALDALRADESEKRRKLEEPIAILDREISNIQARLGGQASAEAGKKSRA